VSSKVREGWIGGVGLRRRERGMGGEVGCVGERSWELELEDVRRRCRYRLGLSLSLRVMRCVTVIFVCVSLVRRP